MQTDPVSVTAQKPIQKRFWVKSVLGFLLAMSVSAAILVTLNNYFGRPNLPELYIVILVPFLSYMVFVRLSLQNIENNVIITITENGIYEKTLRMSGTEIFCPWSSVKKIVEGEDRDENNAPYISLQLQSPRKTFIISSSEIGLDSYIHFSRALNRYRIAVNAVYN